MFLTDSLSPLNLKKTPTQPVAYHPPADAPVCPALSLDRIEAGHFHRPSLPINTEAEKRHKRGKKRRRKGTRGKNRREERESGIEKKKRRERDRENKRERTEREQEEQKRREKGDYRKKKEEEKRRKKQGRKERRNRRLCHPQLPNSTAGHRFRWKRRHSR